MRKVLFLFSQLRDRDVDWLLSVGRSRSVSTGEQLVQRGVSLESLYIVLDGTLSVLVGETKQVEIAQLICGEIVGEMSFVQEQAPTATVTALEASVVFEIPQTMLHKKLDADREFAARFYRALSMFLASRLSSTVGRLGYGEAGSAEEEEIEDDDLDAALLGSVHLAGSSFERFRTRAIDIR